MIFRFVIALVFSTFFFPMDAFSYSLSEADPALSPCVLEKGMGMTSEIFFPPEPFSLLQKFLSMRALESCFTGLRVIVLTSEFIHNFRGTGILKGQPYSFLFRDFSSHREIKCEITRNYAKSPIADLPPDFEEALGRVIRHNQRELADLVQIDCLSM